MTMLKTLVRKDGGCEQIQRYIEKEGECLAYDYSEEVQNHDAWAEEFDSVRKGLRKDNGRKYYHIIISPDPGDVCDLETMRDLATSWMRERYPDAQYVIGYHNDNGRIHAHIAMNSVIPSTGYKVHIDDKEVEDDTLTLQRMSRDRNLSYFEHPHPRRTQDGWEASVGEQKRPAVVYTDAERRLMQKGITPWKQQVRNAIDAAANRSRTWGEFARELEREHVTVRIGRRNVATFTMEDESGNTRKVRGTADNLGSAYTVRGIMLRISKGTGRRITGVMQMPQHRQVKVPSTMEESIERRANRRPWLDPQAVADLISIMRQNDYPDIRDLNDDLTASKKRLDALKLELEAAQARAQKLEEADRKIVEWRRFAYGEDPTALIGSIDNYFEFQAIQQWFDDAGIDPESFDEDREYIIERSRADAAKISAACDEEAKAIAALSQASKTAERLSMPMRETQAQRDARTKRTSRSIVPRHITSREQLAQAQMAQIERTAQRFEESGDEQLKQLAAMQREALLQKQIEETPTVPSGETKSEPAAQQQDAQKITEAEDQTRQQQERRHYEEEQRQDESHRILPNR